MKSRFLLHYTLALLVVLASTAASAQKKPSAEPALVINGTPVEGVVKTIAGKVYVELDQIVKSLNLTLSRSTNVIVVGSASKPQDVAPQIPASISGSLTYYFNGNYGNRPDTGAKVFLLSNEKEFEYNANDFIHFFDRKIIISRSNEKKDEYIPVHQTAADGTGRFEFRVVQPGLYTLVVMSAHSKGVSKADISGKILTRKLEIKSGTSVDASHDFGMSFL